MELRTTGPALSAAARTAEKPLPAVAPQTSTAPDAGTAAAVQAIQRPDAVASQAKLDEALKSINKTIQQLSPEIEFSVDPDSKRTIVKVVDQSTKEVLRQMPSAETLEIAKALDRVQGLLIRQKA